MGRVCSSITVFAMLGTLSACSMQQLREEFPMLKQSGDGKGEARAMPGTDKRVVAEIEGVLRYYHQLSGLAPDQLRAEWDEAKRQFEKEKDEPSRLRLAMLAIHPGTEIQNLTLAGELLRDYKDKGNSGRGQDALGAFASELIEEQLKLVELKRMAIVQLEKLQEQINALKHIEQNIHERELRDSSTKKR